jgi:hypothetical protein
MDGVIEVPVEKLTSDRLRDTLDWKLEQKRRHGACPLSLTQREQSKNVSVIPMVPKQVKLVDSQHCPTLKR